MKLREITWGSADYQAALGLRDRGLRQPLGLNLNEADTAGEDRQRHFAAFDAHGQLIACITARPLGPDRAKLRQMVVDRRQRGAGIGAALLCFAEAALAQQGVRQIELSARAEAQGFYARAGYQVVSDPFLEVGILHVRMVKGLVVA